MNYETSYNSKSQLNNNRKEQQLYFHSQDTTQDSTWNSTPSTTSESLHNIDDEMQQRHMQQLFDKKKRRRESHNAVERRRRDNINERIFELSTLLPERDANKNNKGTILRKSVDHIRLLHEKVNQYQKRVQDLENMLDMYRLRWGDLNNANNNHQTSLQPLDLSGIQPHLHHHHYGREA